MHSLNAWDFGCLVALTICAASGYLSGFVWDTGRWLGVALGVWVANSVAVADLYHWQSVTMWMSVVLVVWGVALAFVSRLSRFILRSPLALIDRLVGVVGGCIRGVVILVGTFSIATKVLKTLPPEMRTAWCYAYLGRGAQLLEKHATPLIEHIKRAHSASDSVLAIEDGSVR